MSDTNPQVAEYLRMSTEHQQYSLDNQRAVISAYAGSRTFSITKTYTDGARSGVVLKRRNGLRQLLQDVMSGQATYRAILVYDVSRWGRFQDHLSEAAHRELIRKTSRYSRSLAVVSRSLNDGSVQNALMKALKRSMAGEYSRELGVKVLAGLKRLTSLGFKPGGLPGYGLRRMLVSIHGQPKQILSSGERKSITTDRVVLVPGPEEEVTVVREIYRLLLEEQFSVHGIAAHLNESGIPYGNSHSGPSALSPTRFCSIRRMQAVTYSGRWNDAKTWHSIGASFTIRMGCETRGVRTPCERPSIRESAATLAESNQQQVRCRGS